MTPTGPRVVPGGCDDCSAEQRLTETSPGVWSLGIYHDDTCPLWLAIRATQGARRAVIEHLGRGEGAPTMTLPPSRKPDRWAEGWETIAVAPLAGGWRNVYQYDGQNIIEPCPAVLLQEHRDNQRIWENEAGGIAHMEVDERSAPYTTRTVFARIGGGRLAPVHDDECYLLTIGPGEAPPEPEDAPDALA